MNETLDLEKPEEIMQSRVDAFNEVNPVGTEVILVKNCGELFKTTVLHPADMDMGFPSCWVKGLIGECLLERVI